MSMHAEVGRAFNPVEDLSSAAIENFLRQSGWEREQRRRGVSAVWLNPGTDASLLLPYNRKFRDYSARLGDALRTICEVHSIDREALPLEIAGASSDIMLLRADQTTLDGSIPLNEATALLTGVTKMILAAACGAIHPGRASYAGRRPAAVNEFLADDVRMGHTMRGSFVITILARHELPSDDEGPDSGEGQVIDLTDSPPTPALTPPDIIAAESVDYTRRVMSTLATGLDATREVLRPNSDISVEEAVQMGVNSQMVESVATMSNFEGVKALDMSFRWSALVQETLDAPERIILPRPDVGRVEMVTQSLKKRAEVVQDVIIGQVVRLERAEGKDEGTVMIAGAVGRLKRSLRMELRGAQYRLAIRAHEERQPVVASGDITLIKRSWWLMNPQVRLVLGEES